MGIIGLRCLAPLWVGTADFFQVKAAKNFLEY